MKIICIGKNYSDHVKEMGNSISKSPIFFLKPNSALLPKRNPFFIPNFSNEIHYEVELVYKIKKVGKSIDQSFSKNYYSFSPFKLFTNNYNILYLILKFKFISEFL